MYELVEEEEEPSLSSFFEHEILVRLKRTINIMYNIFLICYLDKKSKNTTTNEDTQFNINQFVLQCEGYFTWRVSDCEELGGGLLTGDDGFGLGAFYLDGSEYGFYC